MIIGLKVFYFTSWAIKLKGRFALLGETPGCGRLGPSAATACFSVIRIPQIQMTRMRSAERILKGWNIFF
jgi:hypothetical protein